MRRITNVRLPRPLGHEKTGKLWTIQLDQEERIRRISPMKRQTTDADAEDWQGNWLSPMGIDLQINGGLGIAFPELNSSDIPTLMELLKKLWADGVEAICPTIVSCNVLSLRKTLSILNKARQQKCSKSSELLGAHLEGPFITPARRGAHPLRDICKPSLKALNERIAGFEKEISLMTIAPELPNSFDVITRLKDLGIVACIGHTEADAQTCKTAFTLGVRMLTHTFNAMPGLHHRNPGPIAQAFLNHDIAMGLIADGKHVSPSMAVLLQKLAPKQLVLVSDAIAPYGLHLDKYHWDKRTIKIQGDTCYLEDGTLVGGTLPLLEGCKRLAHWSGHPEAAIWSATVAPRSVITQKKDTHEHLLGKSLLKMLRWQEKTNGSELNWQHAG